MDMSKGEMQRTILELGLEGLEVSGDTYRFRCPICGDSKKDKNKKRGHFYWKESKGYYAYKCHNCGEAYSIYGYLKKYEPALYKIKIFNSFRDGKTHNNQTNKVNTNSHSKISNVKIRNHIDNLLKRKDIIPAKKIKDYEVQEYIFSRQIPKEKLKNLYYTENFYELLFKPLKKLIGKDIDDTRNNVEYDPRIFWFIKDRTNNTIGIQGRSVNNASKRRYLTIKLLDDDIMLGNLENIKIDSKIFVTEGYIDSLFLPNAVSLNGSSFSGAISLLSKLKANDVTIIFDNEPYNVEIRKKVSGLIDLLIKKHNNNFGVCLLPKNIRKDGKDINEYVKNGIKIDKLLNIINHNTYYGAIAKIKLLRW